MLLKELFSPKKEENVDITDDVVFFIDNDDSIHKEYFLPIVDKLKRVAKENKDEVKEIKPFFKDMVDNGCNLYYKKFKLTGKPEEMFTKEIIHTIQEKLAKKHLPYIVDGHYDPKES